KMTIAAPFDGVISVVNIYPPAQIDKKQSLGTLITATRLVVGRISEENFSAIKIGDPAIVKFLAYGDKAFNAKVSKKLPTADSATQRYLIYLDVEIPPEQLLPDLTGDVGITVEKHDAQTLVPRRAIKDGRYVYVVEGGRVARREVKLGFTSLTAA